MERDSASLAMRCRQVAELCQSARSAGALQVLLDDGPGQFRPDLPFSAGARTAQIGDRLPAVMARPPRDREVIRKGLVRPLRGFGALEPVTLQGNEFVLGHVTAKSPNSSYRIASDLRDILLSPELEFKSRLDDWVRGSKRRRIAALAAQSTQNSQAKSKHSLLIDQACNSLLNHHLTGFRTVFVDDADGARVSPGEVQALAAIGFDLQLDDAYPDAILFNDATRDVWFVEAVTSDGEVDHVKMDMLTKMAERWCVNIAGATTAYATYADMAKRLDGGAQITHGTSIWVAKQPGILQHYTPAAYA